MLQFLEPSVDEGYGQKKIKKKLDKKTEIKNLTRKYKKEMRSTVRELRRDNQFLARLLFFINFKEKG